MLGWVAMGRWSQIGARRGVASRRRPQLCQDLRACRRYLTSTGLPARHWATERDGKVTPMMFMVLLVPLGLLALLLGMERLERWTLRDRDDI